VLGLMTPVVPVRMREQPKAALLRIANEVLGREADPRHLAQPLRELRLAQRELLPPVVRVQMALHPWVAYGVMPLFALANAGVSLDGFEFSADGPTWVLTGVALALMLGKPIGVISASALAVKLGWCRLPPGVTWGGVSLVGMLAGIGFTMSIFIAMLAFRDPALLAASKLGVLLGSLLASVAGLAWGFTYVRRARRAGGAHRTTP
jgi:NhaA family Na+:H+ antiporter